MKIMTARKRIWDLEGFDVEMTHTGTGNFHYPYEKPTVNAMTVGEWIVRFKIHNPDYEVTVIDANGKSALRGLTLGAVRDTYLED